MAQAKSFDCITALKQHAHKAFKWPGFDDVFPESDPERLKACIFFSLATLLYHIKHFTAVIFHLVFYTRCYITQFKQTWSLDSHIFIDGTIENMVSNINEQTCNYQKQKVNSSIFFSLINT